ncbi:uncharacterized protein F5147DRAFT_581531, partial [Suillus discolor]
MNVRHVPGKLNVIADGLSRQWEGQPRDAGLNNRSEWTVSEDWEANSGLTNDILLTDSMTRQKPVSLLQERFANEPVFLEVVESILGMNTTRPLRDRKRAMHQASQYLIEDGKLWHLRGTAVRARSKVECITKEEAKQLAKEQHENKGHWGRDAIKITLTDQIYSAGLDTSILEAI